MRCFEIEFFIKESNKTRSNIENDWDQKTIDSSEHIQFVSMMRKKKERSENDEKEVSERNK
jgi:hypothetical protein